MKDKTILWVLAGLGVCIVAVVSFVSIRRVGTTYQEDLSSLSVNIQNPPATREKKRITRITIKKEDSDECMELTPDGVVRTYENCSGDPVEVFRPQDPKYILRLFDHLSRVDANAYKPSFGQKVITITIQTDTGTEVIFVPVGDNDNGAGDPDPIEEIIDLIEGDLPQPTQTPPLYQPTPTPTLPGTTIIPTYTPTPTLPPGVTPTVVPTSAIPFTCGFEQDPTGKRPYNVSNIICSTEPSPVP